MSSVQTTDVIDVPRVLRRTVAQAARVSKWTMQPEALLRISRPQVSGWTPLLHLEHVCIVNRRVHDLICAALANPAAFPGAPVNPQALQVLAGGRLPRGTVKAPAPVVPHGEPLDNVRSDAAALVNAYQALGAQAAAIAASAAGIPHPLFGPLPPRHWLRMVEIHTSHHLAICCEISGATL